MVHPASPKEERVRRRESILRVRIWACFALFEIFCTWKYYKSYRTSQSLDDIDSFIDKDIHQNKAIHTPYAAEFGHDTSSIESDEFFIRSKLNDDKSNDPFPEVPEFERLTRDLPEPGYPKRTHLFAYDTSAVEREIEKHDRILVQSIYFMETYDFNALRKSITHEEEKRKEHQMEKKVCINIYLGNRKIPYIKALMMGLLSYSSQENQKRLNMAEIRLLNTEKREGKMDFGYLKDTLSKLPFIHKVHNITYWDEIYKHKLKELKELKDEKTIWKYHFLSDQISGLKICLESGLPYCLMMEEDAMVPVDFMLHLDEQVLKPLESSGMINKDGTGSISILSLYAYFNKAHNTWKKIRFPLYTKKYYYNDVSHMNSERYSRKFPPHQNKFEITEDDHMYGTVAMLYTRDSAKKLVKYLQKVGVDPEHNADEYMNRDIYFPAEVGIPRKHVQPSLVNHIGYYSERLSKMDDNVLNNLNTDVRFIVDPGEL